MNEEIQAAEDASIMDIADKMLTACNGRKIDHCIAAALSVVGTIIGNNPALTEGAAASLHKLADHITASAFKH